ncbi:DUF2236 domain-containing protein [Calidifontibacter sp. DB0510]|uniref:DUF2236 domain-containing protein n=1 Tax=Metallococcus carri TaxID=1656884 RepID=A0A967AZ04_9MICO|nr:oxygenase MpaB family protein [Metallococcus carri]NHN54410.1 DUF2236 domain-containing protein [Metallococcus carri]NOP36751.1 DUF2236 domain-containing protein [Calidifontibacter sp. DB2511S]
MPIPAPRVAMAGVAQKISGFISTTTFGTIEAAERTMTRVRRVHDRIGGVAGERTYRAGDPDLLTWVHIAEISSFLDSYQRFAPSPLSPAEADLYVAQTARAAQGIGVPDPPRSVAALDERLTAYRPVLEAGPDARDVRDFLRNPSQLNSVGVAGYSLLYRGAIATLPPYAARLLGLPTAGPRHAADLRLGAAGVAMVRWMLSDPLIQTDRRADRRGSRES